MSQVTTGLVNQVSNGISQTTINDTSAFHNTIRAILPNYDIFLQGSYANDTAISDINDVDIVAVENSLSTLLSGVGRPSNIFYDIKTKLEKNLNYRNSVTISSKCLKIQLATKRADVVPAIRPNNIQLNQNREPLIIAQNIKNYPKTHLAIGQAKNRRTNGNYKKVVRMLKNYVNNWNIKQIAPSFYVECLVFSYRDASFYNDLPLSLNNILNHMTSQNFNSSFTSVAEDKVIISQAEWTPQAFIAFRQHVAVKLPLLYASVIATNEQTANTYFRRFFNI